MDEFQFNVSASLRRNKLTKRAILSDLNRVFDPLGLLTPILVKGKIFLQQLWQIKADWDSILSKELQGKWFNFYDELKVVQSIQIPRSVKSSCELEIHGFCDASQEAYGACLYVRSRKAEDTWNVQLLCARSRVAPMKGTTIPRLELNGALVLAQLAKKVADSWEIDIHKFKLWTDSTVVLSWLNSQTNRLKVYVGNRINQILELTESAQWNYVNTQQNPADLISRGTKAQELGANNIWWVGPYWLAKESSTWQYNTINTSEQELPELKRIKLALAAVEYQPILLNAYSKWRPLVRAVAWLSRFLNYLKNKRSSQLRGYLTLKEIKSAEVILIKRAQNDVFHDEFNQLSKERDISRNSTLKTLDPFLKDGLILVGGRLQNSNLTSEQKHPVVLPYNQCRRYNLRGPGQNMLQINLCL